MTEIFFIGDTHFGHKNILVFEGSRHFRKFDDIAEHDEEIVRRWNAVVRPKDKVYHLGDFAWTEAALEIGARLNGDKILIMGNHDRFESQKYLKHFRKLAGAYTIGKELLLTHIPAHESQFHRWKYNIHGHLHNHQVMARVTKGSTVLDAPDPRYINVSCEQINLTPISYDELRQSGRIA